MTKQKHFKERVRSRMAKTGESYTTARRHVLAAQTRGESSVADLPHFPGAHPETTALRAALAHAGVTNPHNGEFFTEPMVFGIAGGIGAGVFHFYYAAEDFASFYVAGRHKWHDSDVFLNDACLRFGVKRLSSKPAARRRPLRNWLKPSLLPAAPLLGWIWDSCPIAVCLPASPAAATT